VNEPVSQPAKHGRSLVGFYIALGVVAAMIGLAGLLWKPASARLAFRRLWNRGASMTILDQALNDPYRRTVYGQLIRDKSASPLLKERLEAHKLSALLSDEPDAVLRRMAIDDGFTREVRRWLFSEGHDSTAVVIVEVDLSHVRRVIEVLGPEGLKRQVSYKEDIPHEIRGVSAHISLRDGEECNEAELDRLRQGLARDFEIDPAKIALVTWRPRKGEESLK